MDIWVVEYSPSQNCFHVDTLDRVLETNRRTVKDGNAPGYVPLQIFLTSEDAHDFAQIWKEHAHGDRQKAAKNAK